MRTHRVSRPAGVLALLVLVLLSWNCNGTGVENPNVAPITRLANIPPDSIVSDNPRMTLYWVGDDPDGFVVGYRYRWSFQANQASAVEYKPWVYILNIGIDKSGGEKFALMTSATEAVLPAVYKFFATLPPEGIAADSANKLDAGDSLRIEGSWVWASNPTGVRFPVHVNPNSGTFIFDSQDALNPHVFTVQAIDDHGVLDDAIRFASGQLSGNSVYFVTPQVPPPSVEVITFPGDTVLTLDRVTDTYHGAEFAFRGTDPNSRTIDYSWVVDREAWLADSGYIPWSPFSQTPTAYVTASQFPPSRKFDVKHTLYVRARNEFGTVSIDSFQGPGGWVYSYKDFYTVYPKFAAPFNEKKILLLNCAFDYTDSTNPAYPSSVTLDAYYTSIMTEIGRDSEYDLLHVTKTPLFFPGLGILSNYSTIFIYADIDDYLAFTPGLPFEESKVTEYVNAGGNIVLTVYNPRPWLTSTFLEYVPHTQDNNVRGVDTCFLGARGEKGYPDLALDPAKLDPAWNGKLSYIWAGRASGFGEIICRYDEDAPSPPRPPFNQPVSFEGMACGIRYDGLTYKVVYFGFPLYYCQRPAVVQALQKAFQDVGE